MHTRDITLPDGRTAHVHYNSDWSGDVVVTFGEEPHEESAVMSASLLLGLLRDPELHQLAARPHEGDTVHHHPTGEDWVVLEVDGEHLVACGWPRTRAAIADCEVTARCSDEEWRNFLGFARRTKGVVAPWEGA